MKPANLLSLIQAKNDLSVLALRSYLESFGIKMKIGELMDMEFLVGQLRSYPSKIDVFDGFYIGYIIHQISKEFDLLRFGKDSVVNIELKRENTGERIKEQLVENQYYLSFLEKELFSFTYVAEDRKLFYLNESKMLVETDFPFLISVLNEQILDDVEDINKLFDPSNYLVSPFNSTEAFMDGRYFLTNHQKDIKRDILRLSSSCFISLQGSAGTGKTLLTYDIGKGYMENGNKVLIFHCGNLNNGHHQLREKHGWSIAPIKDHELYDLSEYQLIIVDEAQRMFKGQLEKLVSSIKCTNAKCIFSFDPQQCLTDGEVKRNIPQYLTELVSPYSFKLTENIRVSKEIGAFIKNLFDLSKIHPRMEYKNVYLQYFSNLSDAMEYVNMLRRQGWKAINNNNQGNQEDIAQGIIGQEYDQVVAMLDSHFYYDKEGRLSTKGWQEPPHHNPTKILFQIVTRTRKRLSIVIVNNEEVLGQCLRVLGR